MVAKFFLVLTMFNTKIVMVIAVAVIVIPVVTSHADEASAVVGDSALNELVVNELVVGLIDQSSIAASENGMIAEITIGEGCTVAAGQKLGRLDDRRARIEAEAARMQLRIAAEKSTAARAADLAKKQLAETKQLAQEHQLLLQIALQKADNETRLLASKKSQAVAKNELDRATRSREKFIDSISKSEIDGLRLAYDKSILESDQAAFERQIDRLQAKAEQAAAAGHQLRIERSTLELQQAIADEQVRQLEVLLYEQQLKLAELAVNKHQLLAPFDGVVAEIFHSQGDWVTAGEAVIRIIRLDRLKAEGFVPATQIDTLRRQREVMLDVQTGNNAVIQRKGQIVFVSSEIDPVNDEVKFTVEFDNPDREILPGMRLRLRIGS